jgi:hypothetical protein
LRATSRDAGSGPAFVHQVDLARRVFGLDLDLRMARQVGLDPVAHRHHAKFHAAGDAQQAARRIVDALRHAQCVVDGAEHAHSALVHRAPGLADRLRARRALEQRHAELGFELRDHAADVAALHAQHISRAREAAGFDHLDQHAQLVQRHRGSCRIDDDTSQVAFAVFILLLRTNRITPSGTFEPGGRRRCASCWGCWPRCCCWARWRRPWPPIAAAGRWSANAAARSTPMRCA